MVAARLSMPSQQTPTRCNSCSSITPPRLADVGLSGVEVGASTAQPDGRRQPCSSGSPGPPGGQELPSADHPRNVLGPHRRGSDRVSAGVCPRPGFRGESDHGRRHVERVCPGAERADHWERVAPTRRGASGVTIATKLDAARRPVATPRKRCTAAWRRAGNAWDRRHPPAVPARSGADQLRAGLRRRRPRTRPGGHEGVGDAAWIGISGGPAPMLKHYVETGLFDAVITHNRYTLVDRSAEELIDSAVGRGVTVVNAAVYGGGALAHGLGRSRPTRTSPPTRRWSRPSPRWETSATVTESRLRPRRCSSRRATPASPQPWSGPTPLNTSKSSSPTASSRSPTPSSTSSTP